MEVFSNADIVHKILEYGDDEAILQILSLNKQLRNNTRLNSLIRIMMIKRYPNIIKYKHKDESWYRFYVKMIYFIAMLKEEYDVDYFPTSPIYNPEELYLYAKNHGYSEWRKGFIKNEKYATLVASSGDINLLKNYIDSGIFNGPTGYYWVGAGASGKIDYLKQVEELLDEEINDNTVEGAAYAGDTNMLTYLEENLEYFDNEYGIPYITLDEFEKYNYDDYTINRINFYRAAFLGAMEGGNIDLMQKYYNLLGEIVGEDHKLNEVNIHFNDIRNPIEVFNWFYNLNDEHIPRSEIINIALEDTKGSVDAFSKYIRENFDY